MRDRVRALVARFESADPVDVGARMVFVLFLLSTWVSGEAWYFKWPLRAVSIAALVLPPLHRDWRLWAAFALVLVAKTVRYWFTQDNHIFLLTWFAVGMAFWMRAADPLAAVRDNARRLVGLCFLFAALWKGPLSGEFLDGRYFTYTFLTDPRFHGTARALGVPEDALEENYASSSQLARPGVESLPLAGLSPKLRLGATVAAWWTLAIESAMALAFLAPAAWGRLHRARHWLLLFFGATTYLVIDIETYGWTLMAVGAAQSEPERPGIRALYLGVGLLILAYSWLPRFA